jgi:hypothetical protein
MSAIPVPDEALAPGTRLSCDGETFELRVAPGGGTHYTWLSVPNPGYGFTTSGVLPAPTTVRIDEIELHRANIRGFLSMIDPETGYLAEA